MAPPRRGTRRLTDTGRTLPACGPCDAVARGFVLSTTDDEAGGHTPGAWKKWYANNIPRADALFDDHLHALARTTPIASARWGGVVTSG